MIRQIEIGNNNSDSNNNNDVNNNTDNNNSNISSSNSSSSNNDNSSNSITIIKPQKGWLWRWSRKQWIKHWFVLKNGSLSYYRGPAAETFSFLDGVLDLSLIKSIEVQQDIPNTTVDITQKHQPHYNHQVNYYLSPQPLANLHSLSSINNNNQSSSNNTTHNHNHGENRVACGFSLIMWNGECYLLGAQSVPERAQWLKAIRAYVDGKKPDDDAASDSASSSDTASNSDSTSSSSSASDSASSSAESSSVGSRSSDSPPLKSADIGRALHHHHHAAAPRQSSNQYDLNTIGEDETRKRSLIHQNQMELNIVVNSRQKQLHVSCTDSRSRGSHMAQMMLMKNHQQDEEHQLEDKRKQLHNAHQSDSISPSEMLGENSLGQQMDASCGEVKPQASSKKDGEQAPPDANDLRGEKEEDKNPNDINKDAVGVAMTTNDDNKDGEENNSDDNIQMCLISIQTNPPSPSEPLKLVTCQQQHLQQQQAYHYPSNNKSSQQQHIHEEEEEEEEYQDDETYEDPESSSSTPTSASSSAGNFGDEEDGESPTASSSQDPTSNCQEEEESSNMKVANPPPPSVVVKQKKRVTFYHYLPSLSEDLRSSSSESSSCATSSGSDTDSSSITSASSSDGEEDSFEPVQQQQQQQQHCHKQEQLPIVLSAIISEPIMSDMTKSIADHEEETTRIDAIFDVDAAIATCRQETESATEELDTRKPDFEANKNMMTSEDKKSYNELEATCKRLEAELKANIELHRKVSKQLNGQVDELSKGLTDSQLKLSETKFKLNKYQDQIAKLQQEQEQQLQLQMQLQQQLLKQQHRYTATNRSRTHLRLNTMASNVVGQQVSPDGSTQPLPKHRPLFCTKHVKQTFPVKQHHIGLKLLYYSRRFQKKLNLLEHKLNQIQKKTDTI